MCVVLQCTGRQRAKGSAVVLWVTANPTVTAATAADTPFGTTTVLSAGASYAVRARSAGFVNAAVCALPIAVPKVRACTFVFP